MAQQTRAATGCLSTLGLGTPEVHGGHARSLLVQEPQGSSQTSRPREQSRDPGRDPSSHPGPRQP